MNKTIITNDLPTGLTALTLTAKPCRTLKSQSISFGHLKNLKRLDVSFKAGVSIDLSDLTTLTHLVSNIPGRGSAPTTITGIHTNTNLRYLNILLYELDDNSLDFLYNLYELRELTIRVSPLRNVYGLSRVTMEIFTKLPFITRITLPTPLPISDDAIPFFDQLNPDSFARIFRYRGGNAITIDEYKSLGNPVFYPQNIPL